MQKKSYNQVFVTRVRWMGCCYTWNYSPASGERHVTCRTKQATPDAAPTGLVSKLHALMVDLPVIDHSLVYSDV